MPRFVFWGTYPPPRDRHRRKSCTKSGKLAFCTFVASADKLVLHSPISCTGSQYCDSDGKRVRYFGILVYFINCSFVALFSGLHRSRFVIGGLCVVCITVAGKVGEFGLVRRVDSLESCALLLLCPLQLDSDTPFSGIGGSRVCGWGGRMQGSGSGAPRSLTYFDCLPVDLVFNFARTRTFYSYRQV